MADLLPRMTNTPFKPGVVEIKQLKYVDDAWWKQWTTSRYEQTMALDPLKVSHVRNAYQCYHKGNSPDLNHTCVPSVLNPMRKMEKSREFDQNSVVREISEGAFYKNDVHEDERGKLQDSVVNFVKSDDYKKGLNSRSEAVRNQLDTNRKNGMKDPYAFSQNTELTYRAAVIALRQQQRKDVENYVQSLDANPDRQAVFDRIITNKYGQFDALDPANEDKIKLILRGTDAAPRYSCEPQYLDLPANAEAKKHVMNALRIEEAEKLFKPVHEREEAFLQAQIDESREVRQSQTESNLQWADVIARQTPAMLAAAEEQRQIRWKAACKKYWKDMQQNEPDEFATMVGFVEGQEVLDESFRAKHNADGPPRLEDFRSAMAVDRKREPRKLEDDGFRYVSLSDIGSGKAKGIRITLGEDGSISTKTSLEIPEEIKELKDMMNFISRTVMQECIDWNNAHPDKAKTPKIVHHYNDKEYAKEAYRASRLQGFGRNDIRFDTKAKPPSVGLTEAEMDKIEREIRPILKERGEKKLVAVHKRIPDAVRIDTQALIRGLNDGTMSKEQAQSILEEQEKLFAVKQDDDGNGYAVGILHEIDATGAQLQGLLEKERQQPLSADEINAMKEAHQGFNNAVYKLNTVLHQASSSAPSKFYRPEKVSANRSNITLEEVKLVRDSAQKAQRQVENNRHAISVIINDFSARASHTP